MRSNVIACAVLAALAGFSAAALAQTLPARPAPAGFQSVEGAGGGRFLLGAPTHAATPDAAFLGGLRAVRGYFDAPPDLLGAVRSQDGSVTLGTFAASVSGVPVSGMAYSIFDAQGGSRVAVIFDDARRFGRTLRPLAQQFVAMVRPSAAGSPAQRTVVAQDRTAAATIPADWKVLTLTDGTLAVKGPDDAMVVVRFMMHFTDPRAGRAAPGTVSMPATSDAVVAMNDATRVLAAQAHAAMPVVHVDRVQPQQPVAGTVTTAIVWGTARPGNVTRRFQRWVYVTPPRANGQWLVQVNEISSPDARWARDLPVLTAVYGSYRYDERRQMQKTLDIAEGYRQRNQRTFEDSMRRAAAIQNSIDRSTAAFVDYIGDRAVVSGPGTAGRRMDANAAAAIAKADPRFHVLGLNEYRKGVDY